MLSLMRQIMAGEISPVMTAAILTGLRVKKETIGEIAAAATVMRELSTKVVVPPNEHFLDIVGTGGDGSHTFNISTATMFVAAAAGARVAKHGGRSVSSKSGSADVLEALGVNSTSARAGCRVHRDRHRLHVRAQPPRAMKNVAPVRRDGRAHHLQHPRPADQPGRRAQHPDGRVPPDLVGIQVRVMQRLGAEHVLVVYGRDGMDEVSSARPPWSAS
jgi:anthranilate phosphoribosyltransferase